MKQVNLGSQGLRVPGIGLGCMGMSDFHGSSSEAQNLHVLDRAADIVFGAYPSEIVRRHTGRIGKHRRRVAEVARDLGPNTF